MLLKNSKNDKKCVYQNSLRNDTCSGLSKDKSKGCKKNLNALNSTKFYYICIERRTCHSSPKMLLAVITHVHVYCIKFSNFF
jgi:hypothetical protein